ncbi:response regulator transcription factor [Palleronia abyssalis]|uniref:Transcriptional regulatory protein KdpE n=1 Tax=Palleronia abyssalis TaxID=1501240 RepID=A0A2R8BUP7_9RHOB|nr:response regulator [Palleronia abyssalis]SPJ23870.1 Transcriptional regulatory protein KdpE [Palleronia abyssalis]
MTDRQRVLLIEDEPNIIEAIRFVLSRDGWQVATHPEGRGAVEAVRDRMPDVLILDVMLPDRSGYDILADLRADEALRDLPIMVLTARGQSKEREMALEIGADVFMTKPFSNAEMLEAVRALAHRRDTA